MVDAFVALLNRPRLRRNSALGLLAASLIGWPLSAFTFASGEPQGILGLSWLAITVTALDLLATTDVRVQHEEED